MWPLPVGTSSTEPLRSPYAYLSPSYGKSICSDAGGQRRTTADGNKATIDPKYDISLASLPKTLSSAIFSCEMRINAGSTLDIVLSGVIKRVTRFSGGDAVGQGRSLEKSV